MATRVHRNFLVRTTALVLLVGASAMTFKPVFQLFDQTYAPRLELVRLAEGDVAAKKAGLDNVTTQISTAETEAAQAERVFTDASARLKASTGVILASCRAGIAGMANVLRIRGSRPCGRRGRRKAEVAASKHALDDARGRLRALENAKASASTALNVAEDTAQFKGLAADAKQKGVYADAAVQSQTEMLAKKIDQLIRAAGNFLCRFG